MNQPLNWHTSSHSQANSECVEVAETPDAVFVRHSKDPEGPRLRFTPGEWRAFLAGAHDGEFNV